MNDTDRPIDLNYCQIEKGIARFEIQADHTSDPVSSPNYYVGLAFYLCADPWTNQIRHPIGDNVEPVAVQAFTDDAVLLYEGQAWFPENEGYRDLALRSLVNQLYSHSGVTVVSFPDNAELKDERY